MNEQAETENMHHCVSDLLPASLYVACVLYSHLIIYSAFQYFGLSLYIPISVSISLSNHLTNLALHLLTFANNYSKMTNWFLLSRHLHLFLKPVV